MNENDSPLPRPMQLESAPAADRPVRRTCIDLEHGSQNEIAEVLLGIQGEPLLQRESFGALRGAVFANGVLRRYDPDSKTWPEVGDIYSHIVPFDGASYADAGGKTKKVKVSASFARGVRETLEALATDPHWHQPRGIAFRNGWVSVNPHSGALAFEPLTAAHHATATLPFDWTPGAECPNWIRFLRSVWPNDPDSILLVHQILGYLLSGDTQLQKLFVFLGPTRSGKGTLCKMLKWALGPNYGALSVNQLDGPFALEGLTGKSVLVDADFRRSGAKLDESQAVARLLSLSACDELSVARKNRTAIDVRLPGRVVIATNPPFGLRDVGGAFSGRVVVLPFEVSHLGSEWLGLESALNAEWGAIAPLALGALEQLYLDGCFREPTSAELARTEIRVLENPLLEFFEDQCVFEPTAEVECGILYASMREWCLENGSRAPSNSSFSAALAQRGVRRVQRRTAQDERVRVYRGVRGARAGMGRSLRKPRPSYLRPVPDPPRE